MDSHSVVLMNSHAILLFLIIASSRLNAQNEACNFTWISKLEFYLYQQEQESKPVTPLPPHSLNNPDLFNSPEQAFCKTLNRTLYFGYDEELDYVYSEYDITYSGELTSTYVFPINFQDLEPITYDTSDLVTKKFSFFYNGLPIDNRTDAIVNISTKVPRNSCIRDLTSGGRIDKVFPMRYNITKFYSDFTDNRYYLIEGERCKVKYNRQTKQIVSKKCWNHPYFCRGKRFDCIVNDDENSFCYDTETGEGQKKPTSTDIPYSILIGEQIYWKVPRIIYSAAANSGAVPLKFDWICTDSGTDVLCDYVDYTDRPSVTYLKKLSAYAGDL